ncbi:MAG: CoA ester lyase [Rhizobiaceae bacterium]|nr:CoA ester lyase [Rhizobiaceae bacterium]
MNLSEISCLLFVPGNRPERFEKARTASPEGIVIDLEDAVAPADKAAARAAACAYLAAAQAGPPIFVRINPLGARPALDDLGALADGALSPAGLFLAKVETARDVEIVRSHLASPLPLLVAIETAAGMANAAEIARELGPNDALGFGGADFAADLGAAFSWEALYPGRGALVQAAATGRVGCFDVPCLDIANGDALVTETRRVRALGFTGKLAIHPAQVEPIRGAFRPSEEEIGRARRVVEALDAAGGRAVSLDGKMVDAPVAQSARRTLARAHTAGLI